MFKEVKDLIMAEQRMLHCKRRVVTMKAVLFFFFFFSFFPSFFFFHNDILPLLFFEITLSRYD